MKKNRWVVAASITVAAVVGVSGCASGGSAPEGSNGSSDSGKKDLGSGTILGNWFAQAEMGGYIAADANDLGKKYGIKVEFKQGGPGIQTIPQVAAGKADFGIGHPDEIMVARKSGVPIVGITTGIEHEIQAFAYHKSSGIKDFADFNGHTVSRVESPYWDYLVYKYHLDKTKVINITSLGAFKKDQDLALQIFITDEPYTIGKMGLKDIGYLKVRDSGYDLYRDMLFTTEDMIKEHPDKVQAVVQAVHDGWEKFKTDPAATKAFIAKANPDADPGQFDYTRKILLDGDYLAEPIGQIDMDRIKHLRDQLGQVKLISPDLDYKAAFTEKFVPKS